MFTERKLFFTLFKVFCVFALVFLLLFSLVSCALTGTKNTNLPSDQYTVSSYSDGVNRVDVFVDPETGINYFLFVWHDVKTGGLCPRYNTDGSFYISGVS